MPTQPTPPPTEVLEAFGATHPLELLAGGRGLTWRSGNIVLRPSDGSEETDWKSAVLADLVTDDRFTVPRPIRTREGAWMHEDWQAMEWMPGHADERRVDDVIDAGQAFHEALADLPRPDFLDRADDAWSVADRIAWGEAPAPEDRFLRSLLDARGEVSSTRQIIHGDLLGNVLFADGHPPTIIDWPPYWRPEGFGAAIAMADAVCWHDIPLTHLTEDHGIQEWRELLLRALVFRLATLENLGFWDREQLEKHTPIAEAILDLG